MWRSTPQGVDRNISGVSDAMAVTYDDFLSAVSKAGMTNGFSQWDLSTAQAHPEFGMSILSLKKDYQNAKTDEQRLLANTAANALRKSYGSYTGGADGMQYSGTGTAADRELSHLGSFGGFSYGKAAPTYENQYAAYQQKLLDGILNREDFSWSRETDPQWGSYKKSYLREGERATANALGQAAAASGGRPSSYAVNAATQAGDYYATQLNDMIPTLYQQAYDRYLQDYNMQLSGLNAVNAQEQLDYARYLNELGQFNTDRDQAYKEYLGQYDREKDYYLALLDREQNKQALLQQQVDAILAAGGSPSGGLVDRSGYESEYVNALRRAVPAGGGGIPAVDPDPDYGDLQYHNFGDTFAFTWRGKTYYSISELQSALNRANLSEKEAENIRGKLAGYGFTS